MVSFTVSAIQRVSVAKDLPVNVELAGKSREDAIVVDVKAAIAEKFPKFYEARQRLSLKGEKKALRDEMTLQEAGIEDGDELVVKDLGAQISWRTVYVVEYVGPLLIHPIFFHFGKFWYGRSIQHSELQKVVYGLVMLHFAKRVLESAFLHRFSKGTMPFVNIFRNSAHYWVLGGLLLAMPIYSPMYSVISPHIVGTRRNTPDFLLAGIAIFIFAELSNFYAHWTLRNLRPTGTKTRAIPFGYGFALVSCPNYFFEILAWIAISTMTGSYFAWLFTGVGAYTMSLWALKKHRAYKKEFGDAYPKNRAAIIPFIL